MRRALLCLLTLLAFGCPKSQTAALPTFSGPPKAFQLLKETGEAETGSRGEKRADVFVTVENGEPVPYVVATGEIGPIARHGATVRLYGDEAGKEGWSVDNFMLLEIGNAKGQVQQRVAIGFQQGCTQGAEQIDALGGMKFAFEAGELNLTGLLPEHEPFTIKATVLDTGGVGRVSNVYVILSAPANGVVGPEEELHDK
jgi:hypothetical protein